MILNPVAGFSVALAARVNKLRSIARLKALNAVRYFNAPQIDAALKSLDSLQNRMAAARYDFGRDAYFVTVQVSQADLSAIWVLRREFAALKKAQEELRVNDPS